MPETGPLSLINVSKYFGNFAAVSELSFDISAGQIIGFLGPNGAGKSTSLRIALGIMTPDSGQAELFGTAPSQKALKRVGFLPEERGLYKKMTPRTTIAYFARLKGLPRRIAYQRADELLETSGLGPFATTKNSKLSKGMSQKVQILSTLAHKPDFLILDEPFSGLDPVNQQVLEDMIRAENARGVTILFSTHVMEHAERLCDSIIMMAGGRKVFDGSLEAAYDTLEKRARIGVNPVCDLAEVLKETAFQIQKESFDADNDIQWWQAKLPGTQNAQDLLRTAIDKQVPIAGFMPGEDRLRDVFVNLTGQSNLPIEAAANLESALS